MYDIFFRLARPWGKSLSRCFFPPDAQRLLQRESARGEKELKSPSRRMFGKKIVSFLVLTGLCLSAAPPPGDCTLSVCLPGACAGDTLALSEQDPVTGTYRTVACAVFDTRTDTLLLTTTRTGTPLTLSYRSADGSASCRWPFFAERGEQYRVSVDRDDPSRMEISGGVYDSPQMTGIRTLERAVDSLSARRKALEGTPDTAALARTGAEMEKALRQLVYAKEYFIVYHPENGYSAYLVSDLIRAIPDRTTLDRVRRLYNSLNGGARNTPAGAQANEDVYALIAASEGASVPRFTLTSLEGEPVSPSHYRGRWVVLSFWSSACREANALLVELYEKYHPYGLEIISLATADRPDSWVDAAREDGLCWTLTDADEDLPGQQNIAQMFRIASLPTLILIDPEGKIVFRGRPSGLRAEVERALGAR